MNIRFKYGGGYGDGYGGGHGYDGRYGYDSRPVHEKFFSVSIGNYLL